MSAARIEADEGRIIDLCQSPEFATEQLKALYGNSTRHLLRVTTKLVRRPSSIPPVDEPKGFRHSSHCRRDERYAPWWKGFRKQNGSRGSAGTASFREL